MTIGADWGHVFERLGPFVTIGADWGHVFERLGDSPNDWGHVFERTIGDMSSDFASTNGFRFDKRLGTCLRISLRHDKRLGTCLWMAKNWGHVFGDWNDWGHVFGFRFAAPTPPAVEATEQFPSFSSIPRRFLRRFASRPRLDRDTEVASVSHGEATESRVCRRAPSCDVARQRRHPDLPG